MFSHRTGSGFAINDLLIVLAAGAVMISVLLPAIQNTREGSRGIQCENRLREIALGALVFEGVNGRLPSELSPVGAVPLSDVYDTLPNPNSFYYNQHSSVLVQVAPFIGLEDLLDGVDSFIFDFENDLTDQQVYAGIDDFWFGNTSGAENLNIDVPEFTCPSDNINQIPTIASGQIVATYGSNQDTEDYVALIIWLASDGDGTSTGARTNYVGCFGASSGGDNRGGELGLYRGAIGHREARTSFQIPDGVTNTVLFGENIGTIQWRLNTGLFDRDYTNFWFMGSNVRGRGGVDWKRDPPYNTAHGNTGFWSILNGDNPDYPNVAIEPDPNQGILGSAYHARHFGFGSMHPDGVNFAMLDGSIRRITRTDNWQLLYTLFGAFDGDPHFIKPFGQSN